MAETENRHYAVIDPVNRKLSVQYQGKTVAVSENALILKEVGKSVYNPVYYFPKDSLQVDLEKIDGPSGYCPIKGQSTRWNLKEDGVSSYFAWSYEEALPRSKKISGYLAFNSSLVTYVSEPI